MKLEGMNTNLTKCIQLILVSTECTLIVLRVINFNLSLTALLTQEDIHWKFSLSSVCMWFITSTKWLFKMLTWSPTESPQNNILNIDVLIDFFSLSWKVGHLWCKRTVWLITGSQADASRLKSVIKKNLCFIL